MRIAVISNGPSANLFERAERDGYDRVIGVNEAAAIWRCRWWVCIDWQAFVRITPLDGPFLFTRVSTPQLVRENGDPDAVRRMERMVWHGKVMLHEHMPNPNLAADVPPWNSYSGTSAMILAWHFRADQVDVYGVDLGGTSDCAGNDKEGMRRKERWAHERRIWDGIMAMYAEAGIITRRITDGESREVQAQC